MVGGDFDEDDPNSSSASSPFFKFRYDVFISFRGEDTRADFTTTLYKKLLEKGIRTFLDEDGLRRGDEIHESLLTAIEDSATSIAVISENYANSSWCLEELSKILESNRLLFPVFYKVDPSDVRHLRKTFGDDFGIHEKKFGHDSDKVLRWKKAMEIAGGTAGWDSKNWGHIETREHLFLQCEFARATWYSTHACIRNSNFSGTFESWVESWFTNPIGWEENWGSWANFCATICWYIWKARCELAFNNVKAEPVKVIRQTYLSMQMVEVSKNNDRDDRDSEPVLIEIVNNESERELGFRDISNTKSNWCNRLVSETQKDKNREPLLATDRTNIALDITRGNQSISPKTTNQTKPNGKGNMGPMQVQDLSHIKQHSLRMGSEGDREIGQSSGTKNELIPMQGIHITEDYHTERDNKRSETRLRPLGGDLDIGSIGIKDIGTNQIDHINRIEKGKQIREHEGAILYKEHNASDCGQTLHAMDNILCAGDSKKPYGANRYNQNAGNRSGHKTNYADEKRQNKEGDRAKTTLKQGWKHPPMGTMKINFDVSFISPEIGAGIGLICRDHTGTCRGARGIPCRIETVDEGEAKATAKAMEWAEEMKLTNVIFEGDSSNIIDILNYDCNDEVMDWRAMSALRQFRSKEAISGRHRWFSKVTRQANMAADHIAKIAKLWESRVTWDESNIPSLLFDVINSDCKNAMGAHPFE